jgi:proliferating cell nuclear antigen
MASKNILTITTIQITPFKILMSALKDILVDTNMVFTKEGIRIVSMDKSNTVLVHLILNACNFELFELKHDKIIICFNMFHLYKLISSIDNDDTLTIFIDDNDYQDGIVSNLSIKFENTERGQSKIQKLRLIEPDADELKLPDVKFSSIFNMNSMAFQKIIKDAAALSKKVNITSIGDDLVFKCKGQYSTSQVNIKINSQSVNNLTGGNTVVQGDFSLKSLMSFIKCTNLCNNPVFYMENKTPLIIKYDVAALGCIHLCLSPI